MKGFIFAAGFGERLAPVTDSMPKALVPVINIPVICYPIMLLKEAGIEKVVCNLHYRYNDIITYLERNGFFGLNFSFSIEEDIMGTGGGLSLCEAELRDDDFILINSDVIMDIDFNKVIDHYRSASFPATIVLYKTDRAGEIGPVGVQGEKIVDFRNFLKTGVMSDYIYSGSAVLSPEIFNYLKSEFSSIVYTAYVDIIRDHSLSWYELNDLWIDIGSMESYWKANMIMLEKKELFADRYERLFNKKIEIVSESAEISNNASVVNSVVGEGCVVRGKSEIVNSVLLPGAVVDSKKIIDSLVLRDRIIKV